MGGHSQKSDSFPSSVQYRLDFTNTERGKKREGGDGGIYNFWEKKTPNHRIILIQFLMQAFIFIQSPAYKT